MYANTDHNSRAEFRARVVQESKHRGSQGAAFAKLKDMLTAKIVRKFGALLFSAYLGAATANTQGASSLQAKTAAAKPEENTLAHQIRHQLQVLPYYSVFDYVGFSLDGGKVTLTGQVLRSTLRRDAEAAMRSIEGVAGVSNLIEVLPKSEGDDEVRRGVYRAIYEDSTLQRYAVSEAPSIHIIVKNGTVALEGGVENESDKKLAAARAAGVPGVSSVSNHLTIRAKAGPAN
jgi:hyperosmotically inducible protein